MNPQAVPTRTPAGAARGPSWSIHSAARTLEREAMVWSERSIEPIRMITVSPTASRKSGADASATLRRFRVLTNAGSRAATISVSTTRVSTGARSRSHPPRTRRGASRAGREAGGRGSAVEFSSIGHRALDGLSWWPLASRLEHMTDDVDLSRLAGPTVEPMHDLPILHHEDGVAETDRLLECVRR